MTTIPSFQQKLIDDKALCDNVWFLFFQNLASRPNFSAYLSSTSSNVTGDGTSYTVICDTEVFDLKSNYDPLTGIFMAPVNGKYLLNAGIYFQDIDVSITSIVATINTSTRTYSICNFGQSAKNSSNAIITGGSIMADMNAGDTASLVVQCSGSTKTVDIGGSSSMQTFFQGYLL